MWSFASRTSLALFFYFFLLLTPFPKAAPAPEPTKEAIAQWVRELGDNDFGTREKATEALWKVGKAAEPALKEALRNDDPEVVRRARELIDKFKWGIYPDTPKNIIDRIMRYQASDRAGKQAVIKELFEMGSQGCGTLVKLAAAEESADVRRDLFQQITLEAARALPGLLAEGSFTTLDELLELSLAGEAELAAQNYAAYWLFRGMIDDRIAHFKQEFEQTKSARSAEVLAYLYRAKGDLKNALPVAEKSGKDDIQEAVLLEMADWKSLAKRPDRVERKGSLESLGFTAAFQRLAGNTADFEKTLADLRKGGEDSANDPTFSYIAKALFLNDRPQDALELLGKSPNIQPAFEILCAQLKYREAFALLDKANSDTPALEILKARTLFTLGDKDKARQIFDKYADSLKNNSFDPKSAPWIQSLLEAEFRVGLKDEALAHCALALAMTKEAPAMTQYLSRVFPKNGDAAYVWWIFLGQKYSGEEAPAVMKRLRAVLDGKVTGKELTTLAGEAEQAARARVNAEQEKWLRMLGETCLSAGEETLGKSYLDKAAGLTGLPETLIRLGDYLAEKKQWTQAAERYNQAWEKDRKEPLPLYLRGWALTQAGQGDEGRKWIDQAHWLPLANDARRHSFADALHRRGQAEAARWESELILRTSKPGSYYSGEAWRQLAFDALARKDYLQAADYFERSALRCLNINTFFVDNGAYIGVPSLVHRQRALGFLVKNQIEGARKEFQLCLSAMPGSVDLPIAAVPELDKRGHKREADDLFSQVFDIYEKWCADYPRCSLAHNNLAWLTACCRRQLDKGLEHAQKAVELSAGHAGNLDTLAEVHFQRGDKAKAIEAMKKCLALEPKSAYFQKQLKRLEAGDPTAPLPETAGE